MKKNRELSGILAGVLSAAVMASMIPIQVNAEEVEILNRVSVHDPSIIKSNTKDSNYQYYVLGSHVASAGSDDLIHWEQISEDYENVQKEPFYGNLLENFAEPFQWAGYDDGDCTGGYAVWAPDIIWNPDYQWEDGSQGAYMLYCCTSSTWRRSCIGYLVSKTMDGTYTYVDTVIYSGFTQNGKTDGNSTRNTKWDNDYLNLKELIKKGSENGGIDEVSEKWFTQDGGWNNAYAPNAIDPTVFFDASGEHMYMTYGSWSGGLFILELDKTTGAVIYPGKDSVDEVSGNYTDRYFGTHIAGGNHQSGEAPYIEYDSETGYYYMYETYGGLTATGGYNMRIFRSKDVMGPYLDAAGNNAADSGAENTKYGIKVMGNYQFYNQLGKCAAGHNSVFTDKDGAHYLVYHQRFNLDPQTEEHELRVHQRFMNEDNWPVTAVYEYRGEQICNYSAADVTGTYEFINHGSDSSGNMLSEQLVQLNKDGSITGDVKGTWTKTDSGKGYDYITAQIDGVTYKGVFFKQYDEADEPEQKMTFTAIGNNNQTIWGSKIVPTDEVIVSMAADSLGKQMVSSTREDITLPTSVMGASVSWTSDQPTILNTDGSVHSAQNDTVVTLTATISSGEISEIRRYKVTVEAIPKLIYSFDFETVSGNEEVTPSKESEKKETALLMGDAAVVQDEVRGNVLQIQNTAGAKGVNYLKLPSDTFSTVTTSGYTVSLWANIAAETWDHSAMFEANADGNYPMTRIGANLLARINANGYSDVQGELLQSNGYRGQWEKVVYTVNPKGIRVYLNGKLVGEEKKDLSGCFDDSNAFSIQKASDVAVGTGVIFGDEDIRNGRFDDIKIYSGIMTAEEVLQDYNAEIEK